MQTLILLVAITVSSFLSPTSNQKVDGNGNGTNSTPKITGT